MEDNENNSIKYVKIWKRIRHDVIVLIKDPSFRQIKLYLYFLNVYKLYRHIENTDYKLPKKKISAGQHTSLAKICFFHKILMWEKKKRNKWEK